MVIGYNVGVFDEDIPTENYNCYNVAENIREQESFLGDPPEEEWNHTFDGPMLFKQQMEAILSYVIKLIKLEITD